MHPIFEAFLGGAGFCPSTVGNYGSSLILRLFSLSLSVRTLLGPQATVSGRFFTRIVLSSKTNLPLLHATEASNFDPTVFLLQISDIVRNQHVICL